MKIIERNSSRAGWIGSPDEIRTIVERTRIRMRTEQNGEFPVSLRLSLPGRRQEDDSTETLADLSSADLDEISRLEIMVGREAELPRVQLTFRTGQNQPAVEISVFSADQTLAEGLHTLISQELARAHRARGSVERWLVLSSVTAVWTLTFAWMFTTMNPGPIVGQIAVSVIVASFASGFTLVAVASWLDKKLPKLEFVRSSDHSKYEKWKTNLNYLIGAIALAWSVVGYSLWPQIQYLFTK